ncbi:TPA: hypothetical protein VIQ89_000266, partial [Streptococcus pyogenes]|nr:hypothetical protein [Streptococcus pyogenes]
MKTKSKRFLNLATLCLALLGTALLMGQPVKAEGMTPVVPTVSGNSEGEGPEKYWWHRGYNDGYKEGEKSETREGLDRNAFSKYPQDITQDTLDRIEYLDGYEGGYEAGWRKG